MIYKPFDIIIVPFPFTDYDQSKKRPAVVLSKDSFNSSSNHCTLAMITSALHEHWPHDVVLKNLKVTGLSRPSLIRMKLFTLDNRCILKKIGTLAKIDQAELNKSLRLVFPEFN